jgi:hypothetical protein
MVRMPPPGRPLRVAFAGQRTFVETCVPQAPVDGIVPAFVDVRPGSDPVELRHALDALRPDVVVVFRPELLPRGLLADLPAAVLGVASEPLPRAGDKSHAGLDANLAALQGADPANVDRVLCADAGAWDAVAACLPAWRCAPLPVDDRFYRPVTAARRPPRAIFIGASTWHRETYLISVKHEFDIGHYAYGLMGAHLHAVLDAADAGICLHEAEKPLTFPPGLLLHLAAGHLVFCEALAPAYGLEPGIDVVEIESPNDLSLRLHQLRDQPDAFERVRIRGRAKADQFRASRVWPDLVRDLLADVATFGSERAA